MSAIVEGVFGVGPERLLLFVAAAFTGFFASSTLGIGGAIVLMPVLMLRFSPAEAVALASLVMLVNNALKIVAFRAHLDSRAALCAGATALPAAAVAAGFVGAADERWLKGGIAGLIALALVTSRVRGLSFSVSRRALFAWGALIGVISGLAGAAGPPCAIALRGHGLEKERFIGTVALLAVGLQLAKLPAYGAAGVLTLAHGPIAALLSLTAAFAVALARRVVGRMAPDGFRLALDLLLCALGAWLLVQALTG